MPVPLRPDYSAANRVAVGSLYHAVIATGLAAFDKTARPAEIARRQWGRIAGVDLVLRSPTSPSDLRRDRPYKIQWNQ
jgi:hypothetical protein